MNKNLVGGYYLVSLDDVDLASESEIVLTDVAKLLYYAKKYKFVVFQDIVIDGEKKTASPAMFEADMTLSTKPEDWDDETDGEFVPEELYTAKIYNLYGKNIEIDAEGGASVTDYEVTADPETLFGKFVRIVEASTIDPTALTDEQIELFKSGVFINGEILNCKNPVFFPAQEADASTYAGMCISPHSGYSPATRLSGYSINVTNKTLAINNVAGITLNALGSDAKIIFTSLDITSQGGYATVKNLSATSTFTFVNKAFPQYPADQTNKTYVLKLVDGTLTWVEEVAQ